ncbi:sensor histidine kinase [Phenylobacterium sp.]|uniref:sensor histidine kinase n=1 Tax=Phenylobacterium sp. TaxID=1871053 RepID=UPI002F3FD968
MTDPSRPNAVDFTFTGEAARPRARTAQDERRELDHRLANSLQLAADFLIFEHTRVSDLEARAALIATAERLSAVGQMHRFLAAQADASSIALAAFLPELGKLIAESTGLTCDVDAEAVDVPADMAQQLAIAVNELAMNAAKHAYSWGAPGPLHIACAQRGGRLVLSVADEGRGLSPAFAAHRSGGGLGMTIVQAIVRQLGGLLEATSQGGARFTLTAPLPSARRTGSRSFAPSDDGED